MKQWHQLALTGVLISAMPTAHGQYRGSAVRNYAPVQTTTQQPVMRLQNSYSPIALPQTKTVQQQGTETIVWQVNPENVQFVEKAPGYTPQMITPVLVEVEEIPTVVNTEPLPAQYTEWNAPTWVTHQIEENWHLGNYGTLAPDLLSKVQHEMTDERLRQAGITQLLSAGVSDFTGSSSERVHNMQRALDQLDGRIIAPGQDISYLELVGEISLRTGYQNAKVIYEGVSTDGVGGGACQSSSTLYRAGLMAGLEIVEHKHHSFALPYYGQLRGLDATIWNPTVDLRMRNNTNGNIYIRAYTKDTKMIVLLYGGVTERDTVMVYQSGEGSMRAGAESHWTREIYENGNITVVEDIKARYIPYADDE